VGFVTTVQTGNAALGVLAAALAGGLFNLLFGFLVITRRANQLASGLALMFCGVGLSALIGAPYIGSRIKGAGDNLVEWCWRDSDCLSTVRGGGSHGVERSCGCL